MTQAPERDVRLAGIGSMATRQLLSELAEAFARRSKHPVDVAFMSGIEAAKRIEMGAEWDVAVLASGVIDRLIDAGYLLPPRMDIVRSAMAVAVKEDATRPHIGSSAALRDAILAASRIGYSTGPSGDHLMKLLAHWGIVERMSTRLVQAPAGVPVGKLIAEGAVTLGFQQLAELTDVSGVAVVGPLPDDVQLHTVFSGAICRAAKHADAGRHFLSFLVSEPAIAVKRAFGMAPA